MSTVTATVTAEIVCDEYLRALERAYWEFRWLRSSPVFRG